LSITLREITRDNFEECCDLRVADDQQEFVASNAFSLAQSRYFPELTPLAIYADKMMIGFLLYGRDVWNGESVWALIEMMVDQRFQGKDYGRAAMEQLIERVKAISGCHAFYTSIVPGNTVAEKLYTKLGFKPTGQIWEGEPVLRLDLSQV